VVRTAKPPSEAEIAQENLNWTTEDVIL